MTKLIFYKLTADEKAMWLSRTKYYGCKHNDKHLFTTVNILFVFNDYYCQSMLGQFLMTQLVL